MKLPIVVLFVPIAAAYVQFNNSEQENLRNNHGQNLDRNTQVLHRVPLDRGEWYPRATPNNERYADKFINENQDVINEIKRQSTKDEGRNEAHKITARDIDNDFDNNAKRLKHTRRIERGHLKNRRRSEGKTLQYSNSRFIRELRRGVTEMFHNGLPVWSSSEPEKHSKDKVTNRNGDISDNSTGELDIKSDKNTPTVEEIDLTNRMSFVGDNCATGYVKVFKKCVAIHR